MTLEVFVFLLPKCPLNRSLQFPLLFSKVYRMQEKKVIMNAAIMDSKSLTSDKKLKKELLRSEIDRVRERTKAPPPAGNKENESQEQDAIVIE